MQRKSILINLLNKNGWRITYCLFRNIYIRRRQLTLSACKQLQNPCCYKLPVCAGSLSENSSLDCWKLMNSYCTNTLTRSFYTSLVQDAHRTNLPTAKNARLQSDPQTDLNKTFASKSSKSLQDSHLQDNDTVKVIQNEDFNGNKTHLSEAITSATEEEHESDRSLSVINVNQLTQVRKMQQGQTVSIIDRILADNPDAGTNIDKVLSEDLVPNGNPDEVTSTNQSTALPSRVSPGSVATQTSVPKVPIPQLYSLSPVINESQVLKSLVELGVDVSVIVAGTLIYGTPLANRVDPDETAPAGAVSSGSTLFANTSNHVTMRYVEKGVAGKLMLMDWERDVQPYVLLLYSAGVQPDQLGTVLTKNPYIFEHDVKHLQVRINYLLSKRFTREQIGQMLHRESIFICMETQRIDAKLGFYQKEFRLKGAELRETTARFAKLLTKSVKEFKKNKVYMKQFLGFRDSELRTMFLISPKTFFINMHAVSRKFDYLHNEMGLPHELIAHDAWVLNKSFDTLQARHRFLVKLGRAQYDPQRENYVSLQDIMHKDRNVFCVEVAKASLIEFDDFMKLI